MKMDKVNRRLRSFKRGVQDGTALTALGVQFWKWVYRSRPVPIKRLLYIRSLSKARDALVLRSGSGNTKGDVLQDPFLSSFFSTVELGGWSLDACTLNFLEDQIRQKRPSVIIEFGSGISTACLAYYMQRLHGDETRPYVISFEQEGTYRKRTLEMLASLQVGGSACVIHAPLCQQSVEGIATMCYGIDEDTVRLAIGDLLSDFVVIDGPAGHEPQKRFGTLPLARPFLSSRANFYLDDALRDEELEIAQLWEKLPGVQLKGIYLFGKGLLAGEIVK